MRSFFQNKTKLKQQQQHKTQKTKNNNKKTPKHSGWVFYTKTYWITKQVVISLELQIYEAMSFAIIAILQLIYYYFYVWSHVRMYGR
jgi:ribosomal protein S19E (S16A)